VAKTNIFQDQLSTGISINQKIFRWPVAELLLGTTDTCDKMWQMILLMSRLPGRSFQVWGAGDRKSSATNSRQSADRHYIPGDWCRQNASIGDWVGRRHVWIIVSSNCSIYCKSVYVYHFITARRYASAVLLQQAVMSVRPSVRDVEIS